jgi:mono/diheme cytochrome c family protein
MKAKIYLGIGILVTALYSCDSHTYEEIEDETIIEGDVTYDANVKAIIDANCISCHNDAGVAAYRPLTTYAEVKEAVEEAGLLERIQLQNSEPNVMPQTGRMPQSKIDVILQWNEDGLLEN